MFDLTKPRFSPSLCLTHNCNLDCVYCYQKHDTNCRMSFDTAKRCVDWIFKNIRILNVDGASWARTVHLLGAYWGFCLCGVHAGLHMTGMVRRWRARRHPPKKAAIAAAALAVVAYGLVAFIRRGFPGYMTLKQQFVFFDYSEPLTRFFVDYAFILIMFMALGALLGYGLQNIKRRKLS